MVNSNNPMPTRLQNAQRFYDALAEVARRDDEGSLIFEGHLTPIFTDLGYNLSYYARVRSFLIALGCVEQLQRGAKNSLSVWRLIQRPSDNLLAEADPATLTEDGNLHQRVRLTEANIRDINERLGGLNVATVLEQQAQEIAELRKTISKSKPRSKSGSYNPD